MGSLRGAALTNSAKTHCPKGHPLVEGNLEPSALRLRGVRNCATCHAEQARSSAARQRQAVNEARQILDLSWEAYVKTFGWSRSRAEGIIRKFNKEVAVATDEEFAVGVLEAAAGGLNEQIEEWRKRHIKDDATAWQAGYYSGFVQAVEALRGASEVITNEQENDSE